MSNPGRKTTFWVMATFSFAMLPQIGLMPPQLVIFAVLPILWRVAAELKGWQPLPGWVRHSATALGLATLFLSYGNLTGRRAAVSLLTVMLALKMVECYKIRDARLVVSFSLFLCATQFLFAQGVVMPFYGGLTVVLALVALTQLHREEAWGHVGEAPAVKASLFSELGFSFRLLALAIPVGFAFFLLFPRLPSPLWGIPDTTLDSKSGLSDSMSPGSIQNLFMDDSPAFRVEFAGPPPPKRCCIGAGRCFGGLTARPGNQAFMARISRLAQGPSPAMPPGDTPCNSNPTRGTGCSHWITRCRLHRIPG
jgi:hypothetical protein